ncbi:uncharacterized protein SPPG_07827 [Spizellomyces punctatus DAOM BR117]|uniref:F-box domain-containing protein n=1 Tax=Spizellomyces punctatus (strain DAOM BR117) TaxID=645134 RepID=A0A0L0H7V8_SPIPD|nr:uncharacterized protein SPPG_07827 [Spizellomyces punctatus DAOM BR117]KNC97011.1 hypothetical protein SPPG_07827 [Spizellomyces punctatus DAOM BR117]|eukprot:XP_016605051.1 hypothetical protein SPPG_07827 [Spizellomyces punctatus DAOM BR117]
MCSLQEEDAMEDDKPCQSISSHQTCPMEIVTPSDGQAVVQVSETATLQGLSFELKQRICELIDPTDARSLSQTARVWRQILSRRQFWQERQILRFDRAILLSAELDNRVLDTQCKACGTTKLLSEFTGKQNCTKCHPDETIPKTNAKKEYVLTEKDLSKLYYVRRKNPRYRSTRPMHLYLRSDVAAYAYAKYHGPKGLAAMHKKMRNLEKAREMHTKARIQARREKLAKELKVYHLDLRDDSKTCNDYIQGINNVTLPDAVKTMRHMHIVHIHTNYHQLLDQNLDAARNAGQKSPGFVKVWEKTKKKVEREAMEELRSAERGYWALPANKRNAEMCACGKVLLKDWMAAKK